MTEILPPAMAAGGGVRTIATVHYRGVMVASVALTLAVTLAACGSSSDSKRADDPGRSTTSNPTPVPARVDELPAALDNGASRTQHVQLGDARAAVGGVRREGAPDVAIARGPRAPRRPRAPDGELAFTAGVCVYLPPGYAKSNREYPVIYLLHGGGGDAGDGVAMGHLREIMDGLIAHDPNMAAIVVMPDGTNGQWYDSMGGRIQSERYVTDR